MRYGFDLQSCHLSTNAQCSHGGKNWRIISNLSKDETIISLVRFYNVGNTTITDKIEMNLYHFIIKKHTRGMYIYDDISQLHIKNSYMIRITYGIYYFYFSHMCYIKALNTCSNIHYPDYR